MITLEKFLQFAPKAVNAPIIATALENARKTSSVNNDRRLAHIMGQMFVETGGFRILIENLNYRDPVKLDALFRAVNGTEDAKALIAKGAEAIANRVYASRLGNSGEKSGDGFKYRGSGFIQLTGKANYAKFSSVVGMDLVANPELARQPEAAAKIAFAYWDAKGLSTLADKGDAEGITRLVNGPGLVGLRERREAALRALEIW